MHRNRQEALGIICIGSLRMPQIRSFGQYSNSGIPPYDAYAQHEPADTLRTLHWSGRTFRSDIAVGFGPLSLGMEVVVREEGQGITARLSGNYAQLDGEWNDGSKLSYQCLDTENYRVVGRIKSEDREGRWWPTGSFGAKAGLGVVKGESLVLVEQPWQDSLLAKNIQCIMRLQQPFEDEKLLLSFLLAPVVLMTFWAQPYVPASS